MGLLERLTSIDRRIVFVMIALAVIIPIIRGLGLPVRVSNEVRQLYEAIDALPPGSKVLISLDYDPATFPEVYPMNWSKITGCIPEDIMKHHHTLEWEAVEGIEPPDETEEEGPEKELVERAEQVREDEKSKIKGPWKLEPGVKPYVSKRFKVDQAKKTLKES